MSITNGPKSFCIKSMQILKTKIEAYRKHTIFHRFLIARIKLEFKNFLSCPLWIKHSCTKFHIFHLYEYGNEYSEHKCF